MASTYFGSGFTVVFLYNYCLFYAHYFNLLTEVYRRCFNVVNYIRLEHSILKNFGGIRKNNLTNIMEQPPGNDSDEIENIKFIPSPYYSHDKFISVLHGKNDEFCILSLNSQSIHAKFDRLFILIEELRKYHFEFSAICLQET